MIREAKASLLHGDTECLFASVEAAIRFQQENGLAGRSKVVAYNQAYYQALAEEIARWPYADDNDPRRYEDHTNLHPQCPGLETVYIPGGEFVMGSTGYDNEKPRHHVRVAPFYIGKYPITQSQWEAIMGENPSYFKGNPALPVENVSWNDAKSFCEKIAKATGQDYRLPTEAEWEYACRAGTTGDYAGDLIEIAWYNNNSDYRTHPVGRLNPNDWGVHDMHGNVWEWCEDDWHGSYDGAPADGSAWVDTPTRGSYRVIRGGCWYNLAVSCRSASRIFDSPDYHDVNVGFRVVIG